MYKKVEVQFQFPQAQQRELLRKVQTLEQLKKLMHLFRISQKYQEHSIIYTIRDWDYKKGKTTYKKMSVYFRCCENKLHKPAIHFISRTGKDFQLEDRSTYVHQHIVKQKVVQNQNKPNQQRVSQVHKNYHKVKEQLVKSSEQQDQLEQSEKSESFSVQQIQSLSPHMLQISQKPEYQPMKKKSFEFPSKAQLSKIKVIQSQRSILSLIGHLQRADKFKMNGIRFQSITHEQINKQQFIIDHFIIGFKCCSRANNTVPYLHYIKNGTKRFHLVNYDVKHEHVNGQPKKVPRNDKTLMNKLLSQIMKKRLNISEEDHFSDFSSYDQNNFTKIDEIQKMKNFIKKKQLQNIDNKISQDNISLKKKVDNIFNTLHSHKQQKIFSLTSNKPYKNNNFLNSQKQKLIENSRLGIKSSVQIQKLKKFSSFDKKDLICSEKMNAKQIEKNKSLQSQNKSKVLSNLDKQNSKKDLIFCQLQNYSEKVSAFIVEKSWKHHYIKKSPQKMQSQSQENDKQSINYKNEDRKIWSNCILQILKFNDIDILEIQKDKLQKEEGNICKFQNLLFVRKVTNILSKKIIELNDMIEIYLGLYPIQVEDKQENMQILVAFTLTAENNPNLLWFYVGKESEQILSLDDIFSKKSQFQSFYKVLKQSIIHFDLKKVSFIYLSLDHQLLRALDKISQKDQNKDSEYKFSFYMHFSCLNTLFLDEDDFPQNELLQDQIRTRISNSTDLEDIERSYNLLLENSNQSENLSKNLTNPRILYESYRTLTQPFSNIYSKQELQKLRFISFFKYFYYNKNNSTIMIQPFAQLEQIFQHFNEFDNFAEAFILILRTFDSTLRNVPQIINKKRIIPFKVHNKVNNDITSFKLINSRKQSLHQSIKNIFNEPVFETYSIAKECPSFILETIEQLLIAANELLQKNLISSDFQNQLPRYFVDQQKTYKVSFDNQSDGRKQQKSTNNQFLQFQKLKKWFCTCNFYRQTGIPCQHQILTAVQNKNSLFKEIHPCWKNKI